MDKTDFGSHFCCVEMQMARSLRAHVHITKLACLHRDQPYGSFVTDTHREPRSNA
eukprot:SAG31_NODE_214_length_20084_cov_2.644684_5_plen_55_part_00